MTCQETGTRRYAPGFKAFLRLVIVLTTSFAIVYFENRYPTLHIFSGYAGYLLPEVFLLTPFALAIWNAGLARGLQLRSKTAAIEVAAVVVLLAVFAARVGFNCPRLCIDEGGGWSGEVSTFTSPDFLGWVGAWLLVTSIEEIAFRGYVLREVLQSLRGRKGGSAVALAVSSSAFALFHIAIPGTGLDSTTANFLVQALVSGLLFGLTYWLTGWNLSVSVTMHFFYDAFGGVLNSNPFDQLWPYRVIFVFILLPSLAAITIHQVMKRARKAKGIMTTSQTDEPGHEL